MVRLLDLFCGAGGASMGYHRAGFDVEGVDLMPQPRYPFRFHQGDALEYVTRYGHLYDVIAASPPCQAFTILQRTGEVRNDHPDLVAVVRTVLISLGRPWIIENVPGAPLVHPVLLCGSMFGLRVKRHRLFELSHQLVVPAHRCFPPQGCIRVLPDCVDNVPYIPFTGRHERQWRDAAGLGWCKPREARQCVPPAYTEYLGRRIILLMVNQDVDKDVDNPLANDQHSWDDGVIERGVTMTEPFTVDESRKGDALYWCDYGNHWTDGATKTVPVYDDEGWHHNDFICEECWNESREN